MPKLEECPFGESVQKYWDKRYQYFSRWDDGIQTDEEGLYSVIPEEVAEQQAKLIHGDIVLDGFAGIGGSAIGFARAGKQVIAVEKDAKRLAMARNNAKIYGVDDEINFIHGDFFRVADALSVDIINLDPPWGGPAYKVLGKFLLEHFSPNGNELLNFSLQHASEVMLRVPTIFDMSQLERFDTPYTVTDDTLNDDVVSRTILFSK